LLDITHVNFAKGYRGGERQTELLIRELAKRGYKQKILTRENSPLADRLKDVRNLTIKRVKKPYFFSLKEIKNSSLLHAHETKAAQFALFANLFYKTPYIITRRVDNPIKKNILNRAIYERSRYTIPLSTAIKNELLKISPNIDIKIIPSAYTKFKKRVDKNISLKDRFKNKFLIGHIGELDNSHKGQIYLIEAIRMLMNEQNEIHLVMLGKGRDEQKLKEISKDLKYITFEGFVDNVDEYIESFDLFVFPSLHEGLGSILLDVMRHGIPIIATDVGGIPDIIKDEINGILVPPKDSISLYIAIKRLYLDKELRDKLAQKGLEDIKDFSPSKMCDRYIEVYNEN
jgi:glycosyltransferase involved in cell wall biosynthesis